MLKRFKFDKERFATIYIMNWKIKRAANAINTEEDNYKEQVETIGNLIDARNKFKHEGKQIKGLDPTVVVSGGIGLIGILLMLNFEKDDIINSKSLPSIGKWFGM